MRALTSLVIGMGILLVAGVAVIVVTLVHRMGAPPIAISDILLAEPAGTRITTIAPAGDRLAVLLQGGGADRVVFVDAAHGHVLGHLKLAP
jgi:hypothetical protein